MSPEVSPQRGAKVKNVWYYTHITVRSLLSFLFPWPTGTIALISTCGERKAGIRCRGDGYNTKVPRVNTNHISSFARIFRLSILLVIMWTFLFLWILYSVFLVPDGASYLVFFFCIYFRPARYRPAELRRLLVSQLDTYNCYVLRTLSPYFMYCGLSTPYGVLRNVIEISSPAAV